MVYQNLKNITEEKEYWDKYIKFHELYWDGPNASQNVFYGNEYEEYRSSLSKYLEVDPDNIKDCLFTKHESGEYYLTPLGVDSDKYIMESENSIPSHWFLLFENSEKKFFYSHAGEGAIQPDGIYYNTDCSLSKKRLNNVKSILENQSSNDIPNEFELFTKELAFGLSEIYYWIEKFPDDSMIVLNYAEISSVIHEFTLKNENSVSDLWAIIDLISSNNINLITVGVGEDIGSTIPIRLNGAIDSYKKDSNGDVVITKRNSEILTKVAELSNGIYIDGNFTEDALEIVKSKLNEIDKSEFETAEFIDYKQQFQIFLLLSLVFIICDVFVFQTKTKWIQNLNLFNDDEN